MHEAALPPCCAPPQPCPARRAKTRLNRVGKAERLDGKKKRGTIKAGRGKVQLD